MELKALSNDKNRLTDIKLSGNNLQLYKRFFIGNCNSNIRNSRYKECKGHTAIAQMCDESLTNFYFTFSRLPFFCSYFMCVFMSSHIYLCVYLCMLKKMK